MSIDVETLLLLRAKQEAEAANSPLGPSVGATGGALLGLAAGSGVRGVNQLIGGLKQRLDLGKAQVAAKTGNHLGDAARSLGMAVKPGARMAGGLVGALVGGGLGYGLQQMAMDSTAGDLLAKIQTHGGLSDTELASLEQVLANTYRDSLA